MVLNFVQLPRSPYENFISRFCDGTRVYMLVIMAEKTRGGADANTEKSIGIAVKLLFCR